MYKEITAYIYNHVLCYTITLYCKILNLERPRKDGNIILVYHNS